VIDSAGRPRRRHHPLRAAKVPEVRPAVTTYDKRIGTNSLHVHQEGRPAETLFDGKKLLPWTFLKACETTSPVATPHEALKPIVDEIEGVVHEATETPQLTTTGTRNSCRNESLPPSQESWIKSRLGPICHLLYWNFKRLQEFMKRA